MAWRPPAMHTGRSSCRASGSARRTVSRLVGVAMRKTRVELSCEWTSLTRIFPGSGFVAFFAWDQADCGHWLAAAAAAAAARRRNFRREVTRRILDELLSRGAVKLRVR